MNTTNPVDERFRISQITLSPEVINRLTETEALAFVRWHQMGFWVDSGEEFWDEDSSSIIAENERSLVERKRTSYVMSRLHLSGRMDSDVIVVFTALQREATVVCFIKEMTIPFMQRLTPEMLDLVGS